MVKSLEAQAVFLDHNYCKIVVETGFTSIWKSDLIKMADSILDWKDSFGVEFDPPSIESNTPLSALSPSHSTDSGLDNEMNLLSDLDKLDLDMLFPVANTNGSHEKKDVARPTNYKNTSPTAKPVCEMTEAEKSRKNALAARENRIKKKKYIEGIEKELGQLRKENELLKAKDQRHNKVVEKLEEEVSYLKNVLANQSTLSVLMNRLVSTPGISFTLTSPEGSSTSNTSTGKELLTDNESGIDAINTKKNDETEVKVICQSRYQTRGAKRSATTEIMATERKKRKEVKGGVCLHVGKDMVSLTFCSQCSSNVSS